MLLRDSVWVPDGRFCAVEQAGGVGRIRHGLLLLRRSQFVAGHRFRYAKTPKRQPNAKPLPYARICLKEASLKHHGIYDALVCAHHARGNAAAHPPNLREYVVFCPVTPHVGPYEQPNEPSMARRAPGREKNTRTRPPPPQPNHSFIRSPRTTHTSSLSHTHPLSHTDTLSHHRQAPSSPRAAAIASSSATAGPGAPTARSTSASTTAPARRACRPPPRPTRSKTPSARS